MSQITGDKQANSDNVVKRDKLSISWARVQRDNGNTIFLTNEHIPYSFLLIKRGIRPHSISAGYFKPSTNTNLVPVLQHSTPESFSTGF